MKNGTWKGKTAFCLLIVFLAIGSLPSCSPREPAESSGPNAERRVDLLAEDQVRLSNTPEKTEIFRDAGLGLFGSFGQGENQLSEGLPIFISNTTVLSTMSLYTIISTQMKSTR